jgi:hypothetical protein
MDRYRRAVPLEPEHSTTIQEQGSFQLNPDNPLMAITGILDLAIDHAGFT